MSGQAANDPAPGRRAGFGAPLAEGADEHDETRLVTLSGWRLRQVGVFALELVTLAGSRWAYSTGARMALRVRVDSSQPVTDVLLGVWDVVREQPPPGRDRVFSAAGDGGQVVVAHGSAWSVVARSGGPFLVMADVLGRSVWRVDGDEVWQADLEEMFRELFEVSQGRPAVDESVWQTMPRLPWHDDPDYWRRGRRA